MARRVASRDERWRAPKREERRGQNGRLEPSSERKQTKAEENSFAIPNANGRKIRGREEDRGQRELGIGGGRSSNAFEISLTSQK